MEGTGRGRAWAEAHDGFGAISDGWVREGGSIPSLGGAHEGQPHVADPGAPQGGAPQRVALVQSHAGATLRLFMVM